MSRIKPKHNFINNKHLKISEHGSNGLILEKCEV